MYTNQDREGFGEAKNGLQTRWMASRLANPACHPSLLQTAIARARGRRASENSPHKSTRLFTLVPNGNCVKLGLQSCNVSCSPFFAPMG
ncbi:hypothetical protein L596_029609 [Steinernema carpocapsae]|uniref:Uncharacterized protein n=1 Tax=Steinernema carpocapsae TaxID=34508 RepID=A0A4U5LV70_STECR|nr:hypothetical protein L596_029609 [Steinernema carpocapsae]